MNEQRSDLIRADREFADLVKICADCDNVVTHPYSDYCDDCDDCDGE